MSLIGIPSLPNLPTGKGVLNNVLAYGQSQLWTLLTLQPTWGVYEAGSSTKLAVEVDSVVELSVKEESDVPDYRLQTGSFASYNKISNPINIPLKITKGGSITERQAFVSWLQTAVRTPIVYDILTPEVVYQNVTLTEYSIDRTQEGGEDLIAVVCKFVEIREAPAQYYDAAQGEANTTNSSDADGVPTAQDKQVQAKTTTDGGVQNIFSMERIKNAYTTVKATASSIVESITTATSKYYDKVKGWFS